jgi:tetratricopeptide (TPR) repeat protein
MTRAIARWTGLGVVVVSCLASGCITVTPASPSFSLKSLSKPKIERAKFEEKVDELPSEPRNPAKLKLAYGKVMEDSGQLAEARKQYQSVTDLQPKNVDAILGLARLDQLGGNLDQAEQGYKKAVKLAPNSASAQFSLGDFYASQQRWSDACDPLTKAMLAQPDESQYRYALAVALAHRGDVDSALPHFIRTVGDAEAHYNVGLILQSDGKLAEAERQFALSVAKKPDISSAPARERCKRRPLREFDRRILSLDRSSRPDLDASGGDLADSPDLPVRAAALVVGGRREFFSSAIPAGRPNHWPSLGSLCSNQRESRRPL